MNYTEFMNIIDAYGKAERKFGKKSSDENIDNVVNTWKRICELAVKIDYKNLSNTLDK